MGQLKKNIYIFGETKGDFKLFNKSDVLQQIGNLYKSAVFQEWVKRDTTIELCYFKIFYTSF